jgi:hypothetical protein
MTGELVQKCDGEGLRPPLRSTN